MVKTGGPLATLIGICVLALVFAIPVSCSLHPGSFHRIFWGIEPPKRSFPCRPLNGCCHKYASCYFLCPYVWIIPQQLSLMTAELSTMFPENGGFVLWARAAYGDRAGSMAAWLQFCCSAVDTALYPGLFLTYISQTTGTEYSDQIQMWVKAVFFVVITALNLAGIDSVGHGSSAMMLFLLTPFLIISLIGITGAFNGTTITGWDFNVRNLFATIPTPDWSQFILVMIWNMGMWETASVCSGEVDDVAKTFPPALAATVAIVVLNYAFPIASFVGLDGQYDKVRPLPSSSINFHWLLGQYLPLSCTACGMNSSCWKGCSRHFLQALQRSSNFPRTLLVISPPPRSTTMAITSPSLVR